MRGHMIAVDVWDSKVDTFHNTSSNYIFLQEEYW